MRGWVASLTKWWNRPLGGFAELDQQILKFRQLKEEYSKSCVSLGDGLDKQSEAIVYQ